ncbi:MAG: CotH kinase family protein [Thermoclostridium sp.]|nr:CotH kinase family protein [Thermoclostridium sp.]
MSKRNLLITITVLLLVTVMFLVIIDDMNQPVFSSVSMPTLLINEVMPVNQSVLIDQEGDTPDWIELYNTSSIPVRLMGYGLSDDTSKPGKWLFPDVTIPARSFLVIFASGKNKFTGKELHASFSIRSKGEELILSDPQGETIDEVEIPACETNCSYGRLGEKPDEWSQLPLSSPGFPNTETGAADFEATRWASDSLQLNEVMADNISVLQDEDGDYSDWLEIVNTGSSVINLTGYALSNDKDNLFAWCIPASSLAPGENLLIFCSGKNRIDPALNLHTNFKINKTSDHLYFTNPRGKILDYAEIRKFSSDASLARTTFGEWEISEQPTPGYENSAEGYAGFLKGSHLSSPLLLTEVMSKNDNTIPDENSNFYDWAEIKNETDKPLNLENYWLSDDGDEIQKWRFPSLTLEPGGYALVFLSSNYDAFHPQGKIYMHASFSLSASGDMLYLSDTTGTIVQKLCIPELTAGVSYGSLDQEEGYFYFSMPTPGRANDPAGRFEAYTKSPEFSVSGGYYTPPFTLTIQTPQNTAAVHYTTDGSEPTLSSPVISGPLKLDKTTVVRAVACQKGFLPSPIVTNTYILEPGSNLATVCISTNPENLWSEETGIYAYGKPYEDVYPFHGANFWQDWEKPAHIEFFENDGSPGFSMDAGISIRGEYTQALDQKSFGIDARKKYGSEFINYKVFDEKPYSHYQSLVLRNSGQDNANSKLRDVLVSQLMKESGLDYQAYRPAVLYLNGEYWGFYTLRESTDRHFLHSNHPEIDIENLDIMEGDWRVHQGDKKEYQALRDYIESHDLSVTAHYEYVKTKMDIDNYIDYQVAVVYGANEDNGNIKFWRERKEGSRWRWILFDFDMGFYFPDLNMVKELFNPNGTGSDDMFSTLIPMGLLQNREFRDQFLRTLATHMKTTFEPQRCCDLVDELAAEIEPEMERNYTKWKGSVSAWKNRVNRLKDFFVKRPENVKKHIQQYFNLSDQQMKEYGF